MRLSNTKTISVLLILFSVILFLGGIAINLVSEAVGASLKELFGERYRLFITLICIVLAIIAGIMAWLQFRHSESNQRYLVEKPTALPEVVSNLKPTDHSDDNYRNEPTPQEIKDQIKKSAPFQRTALIQSYIGLKVVWELRFYNIRQSGKSYMMTMDISDRLINLVTAPIDIAKYPEVKIINRGHKVLVKGEISDIDSSLLNFELRNPIFTFS